MLWWQYLKPNLQTIKNILLQTLISCHPSFNSTADRAEGKQGMVGNGQMWNVDYDGEPRDKL